MKHVKKYFDSEEYYYQTFVEGIIFGNYKFDIYKSDKKELKELDVFLYADNEKVIKDGFEYRFNLNVGSKLYAKFAKRACS